MKMRPYRPGGKLVNQLEQASAPRLGWALAKAMTMKTKLFPIAAILIIATPTMAAAASLLPTGDTVAAQTGWTVEPALQEERVPLESGAADSLWLALEGKRAPLASGWVVSSGLGLRTDPFGQGERWHAGVDLPAPAGAAVRATLPGRVVFRGWAGGYGQLIELDHGQGIATRYAHLSRILVLPGQSVVAGMPIGEVGSTGRSTGSHLHYELRIEGEPVNPLGRLPSAIARAGTGPLTDAWLPPANLVAARWTGWSDPRVTGELPRPVIQ
jgi:murein DD-endopeptidase MepM/ murein hydrolase activator NlpD